jgi:hypothetical protein
MRFNETFLHPMFLGLKSGIQQIQRHLITILSSSDGNQSFITVLRWLVNFAEVNFLE